MAPRWFKKETQESDKRPKRAKPRCPELFQDGLKMATRGPDMVSKWLLSQPMQLEDLHSYRFGDACNS